MIKAFFFITLGMIILYSQPTYAASQSLSSIERAYIMDQFSECWVPLLGIKKSEQLSIKVEIMLDRTGYVSNYKILTESPPGVDPKLFKAALGRVIMALENKACRTLRHVPSQEKYDGDKGWWRMELNFDYSKFF
ncbi:MAG: hypothetical protein IPP74_06360 [Alphaproteobacteria bacterium]|nr:hypothetical protein [Alphaproteobacteria bacterium]